MDKYAKNNLNKIIVAVFINILLTLVTNTLGDKLALILPTIVGDTPKALLIVSLNLFLASFIPSS